MRLRPRRRLIAGGMLAAWAGSLAWLLVREVRTSAADGLDGPRRIGPGAEFYAVVLAGERIGTASLTIDTTTTGYSVREILRLDLPGAEGSVERHLLMSDAQLTRSFRLREADANISSPGNPARVEIRTRGDSLTTLAADHPNGRPAVRNRFPLATLTLAAAVPLRLAQGGLLRRGGVSESAVLDLVSEAAETTAVSVHGDSLFVVPDSAERDPVTGTWRPANWDTVQAWAVERRSAGTLLRIWIDREGRPVRQVHAFGPVVERTAFELASGDASRASRDERIRGIAIPGAHGLAAGPVPDTGLSRVVLLVSRRDGPAWPGAADVFAGGRQSVRGDTVVIVRGLTDGESSATMRSRNIDGLAATESILLEQVLARALERYEAVGDTLTRLVFWVARDVRLDLSPGAPVTAGQVRAAGQGGPIGKARLLVELARLAGIPARLVSGVLVTEPGLPFHTWVEAGQEGWMAVDPVFGHVPASAALLRVMEGPGRSLALVPRIGALDVTVLTP